MDILITEPIATAGIDLLKREKGFQLEVNTKITPEELAARVENFDALIVRSKTKVDQTLIERADSLKVIGRAGTGVDNVDVEAATKRGIVVMNTPGGNSVSVAEHTVALMLALARYIPQATASMKDGKWEKQRFTGIELKEKTLGIVGLGKIGTEVARRAAAFQMKILAYDPFVSAKIAQDLGVDLVALEDLFSQSDFISLHTPLTETTKHLINQASIKRMKNGVRIINCARGELINEEDFYAALTGGKIAAAALDVFSTEPPRDSRIVALSNVISTPHIAASTYEAQETVGFDIALQIRDFLKEGIVRNAVNFPSLSLEEYKKIGPYVRLGEALGSLISQISEGRMNEIGIRYYGDLTDINTNLVSSSVVKGVLKPILSERVTMVNALTIAAERGMTLVQSRSTRTRSFSNLISVKLRTSYGEGWVEGTVLHQSSLRTISVDGIDIEAPLSGTIVFIRNNDRPGVIGQIGTVLGNHNINIANFTLGRNEERKEAIGMVSVDDLVPENVVDQIKAIPAIKFVKVIRL